MKKVISFRLNEIEIELLDYIVNNYNNIELNKGLNLNRSDIIRMLILKRANDLMEDELKLSKI